MNTDFKLQMMKILLSIFLLVLFSSVYAQDTLDLVNYYDGTKSFKLATEKDTSQIFMYENGKVESQIFMYNEEYNGIYLRYYKNGNLMWRKYLRNAIEEGKTTYYNDKGIKVAEFNLKNGKITDTLFLKKNTHLILGKITSSSIVHGGAQHEDGRSNISEYHGPFANFSMYAVKVDSQNAPVFISNLKSDFKGDFFILSSVGKIGFFPSTEKIENLPKDKYCLTQIYESSGNSSWSIKGTNEVKQNDLILYLELHYSSVGYAP